VWLAFIFAFLWFVIGIAWCEPGELSRRLAPTAAREGRLPVGMPGRMGRGGFLRR
jgi:hypothetical protein